MAKYHIFSISAQVTPSPTTTKANYVAELILKTSTDEFEEEENKRVGEAETLQEAMAIAEKEAEFLNNAVVQFAKACLAKFEDV